MADKQELRVRYFENLPALDFLQPRDRYLLRSEEPRYRINVIGAGTMGLEHMRVTHLEGRAAIHGIYDTQQRSIENARREFAKYSDSALGAYDSLEAACTDPAADALIICTPNHTHLDVLKEAVKAGKPVLLEKPMATTVRDAFEIIKLAENTESFVQIGLQYRFKSIYAESIREVMGRQVIGDVRMISMLEHRPPFLDKVGQWNKFARYSGGTLVEKCCHYFDLMNIFADSLPVRVFATGAQGVNFREFEYAGERSDIMDHAFVTIDYESGVRAGFQLSMFAPNFTEELIIIGDRGRLKAYEESDFLHGKKPVNRIEIQHGETAASRTIEPAYAEFIESSGHHGATFFEHALLIDRLEGRQVNIPDARQGFWAVAVGAAAEASVKRGQPVEIEGMLAETGITINDVI